MSITRKLTIAEFTEKYHLCDSHVYVAINNGQLTDSVVIRTEHEFALIDEKKLLRRKQFQRDVWLFNQDFYYLLSEWFTDAEIIKACDTAMGCSMNSYIHKSLFLIPKDSILEYKITRLAWTFNKFARLVLRDLKRRYKNKEINMSSILDKRMPQ